MNEINAQKIKNIFKHLLKKNSITYEEVAKHLNCSLPTVNRILGPEELTLTRVLELCELLNLPFSDLAAMTKEATQDESRFTESQETFLAKNGNFLAYFMKLLSGDSPKKIAEDHGLNQRSTDKFLIALENQALIKVTGKNKVRPVFPMMPNLGKGPLGRIYYDKIIAASARFFTEHIRKGIQKGESSTPAQMTLSTSKMTRLTYQKFADEQERIITHYNDIADLEEKIRKSSELMTVVMMSAHTLVPSDDEGLKPLDRVFGEVKNI